jgi:hypothetical protein
MGRAGRLRVEQQFSMLAMVSAYTTLYNAMTAHVAQRAK